MNAFVIRTGSLQMDIPVIHHFLSNASYWARGISFELVENSVKHSFCIGAFIDDEQVAFGRVITDYTTFGWLADFFVLPPYRGKGISKAMLSVLMEQPWARRLRRLMLNTLDAHGLYRQYGFEQPANTATLMEVYRPQAHLG
ncbi:GNAT family N-acetyltransferase [Niabella drilacis]|uniref:N-acetylglutamate synthase, GNAT family n=1 Tax=Niabella drilacis (strain DSM 25811 / CCM 8410 / CCUG 62505 / LMG 26954 / E90) TaxID=1285928 RepID=A0A1G6VQ34_NIADE|nr:GNAT family N-acetyltransferase [Niabella drilacis]SDD55659.1 N-acetylglutamate synthase, GNAT family [Niabella drilacis]